MRKIISILSILILISAASAITASQIPEDPSDDQIDNYVELYNNNTDQIPSYARSIIGSQDINLNYENTTYGVEMRDLKIEEAGEPLNQSSLDVWLNKEDIVEVANATSPRQELKAKLDNNEIRYEEKGILNKVKFTFLRLFL